MKSFKLLGLVAILAIFMSTTVFAQGGLILKAEADVSGKLKDSDSDSDVDTKMGFGISAEFMLSEGKFVYGVGGAYLLPRAFDEEGASDDATMSFIPVYGVVKYNLMQGNLVPQVIGHIGYDFWTASDEFKGSAELAGGIYWAAGAGVEIGQIVVTAMYKVFSGKAEIDGTEVFSGAYNTFTLGAGFAF